jgi:hypothetical protein
MSRRRHLGITGRREGGSPIQLKIMADILANAHRALEYRYLHHGDCFGIDEEAHGIAKEIGYKVICHPPSSDKYRAFTEGHELVLEPRPFLERNKRIVEAAEVLLAFPTSGVEVLRSGTWATIRHARRCGVTAMIVSADGLIRVEDNVR